MMDLTENFLKLLQLALIVVGVLAIYFSFISYNITIQERSVERDVMILGNFLLSNDCLTYSDTKSLFDEDKLIDKTNTEDCLRQQYLFGLVDVELQDESEKWLIEITTPTTGKKEEFNVVVRMNSGESKSAIMVVKI